MNNFFSNFKITTPRLVLRVPSDEETNELAKVAARGIQKPLSPQFQDENLYNKPEEELSKYLQSIFDKNISEWNKNNWQLSLAVFYENKPIGFQTVYAKDFSITKGFGCGYWIGLDYQGIGLGTEMVTAALSLGFDGLCAREAYLGAWSDNTASLKIMEKFGFIPNGEYWMNRNGEAVKDKRMRLPKENWNKLSDITIEGLNNYLNRF
jgi:RimJ/RimL family protein N-acetyltransferase